MEISLGDLVDRLSIINIKISILEGDVRNGKLDGDLVEVGKRAIQVRDFNKERIALKNALNELSNTGFKEVKVNHASQTS